MGHAYDYPAWTQTRAEWTQTQTGVTGVRGRKSILPVGPCASRGTYGTRYTPDDLHASRAPRRAAVWYGTRTPRVPHGSTLLPIQESCARPRRARPCASGSLGEKSQPLYAPRLR
eukprot:scaffold27031_cov63-Phaeocystis_antarctica.AAC.5